MANAVASSQLNIEIRLKQMESLVDQNVDHLKLTVQNFLLSSASRLSFINNLPIPEVLLPAELNQADKVLLHCTGVVDGRALKFVEQGVAANSKAAVVALANCAVFVYKNVDAAEGPITHKVKVDEDEEGSGATAAQQWELPNAEFDDLWENLVFEDFTKDKLLKHVKAVMKVSDRCPASSSVLAVNRLFLFYGPPGTGKTTICKAMAQRVAIRMRKRYSRAVFVEVNSHSLFSKFYSESGKLVGKLFETIRYLLADSGCLVFVLIDEVESLTMARSMAMNGNEPSDSVRVVNAILTQIDQIKRMPNALILTTSNLIDSVDKAFLDRADLKLKLNPPPAAAVYSIFRSCIAELRRGGLLTSSEVLLDDFRQLSAEQHEEPTQLRFSRLLHEISKRSVGLSGRMLRKLPTAAYAEFDCQDFVGLEDFLRVLLEKVDDEQ